MGKVSEKVQKRIRDKTNYILLSEYEGQYNTMQLFCPIHGRFEATPYRLTWAKNGCPKCAKESQKDKLSLNPSYVKEWIEKNTHFTLVSQYTGIFDLLVVHCPKHGNFKTTFDCLQNSSKFESKGCSKCGREISQKKQKFTFSFVKTFVESKGYKLISKSYENSRKKLDFYCTKHGRFTKPFEDFKAGYTCTKCLKEKRNLKEASHPVSNFLYYSKISQDIFWGIYQNIKNQFKKIYFGQLTNECKKDTSGRNWEFKIFKKGSYRAFDFFIQDILLCIEFDGRYFHSKKEDLHKEYILRSTIPGVKLWRIKDNENFYNKNKEKTVKNIIYKYTQKIFNLS